MKIKCFLDFFIFLHVNHWGSNKTNIFKLRWSESFSAILCMAEQTPLSEPLFTHRTAHGYFPKVYPRCFRKIWYRCQISRRKPEMTAQKELAGLQAIIWLKRLISGYFQRKQSYQVGFKLSSTTKRFEKAPVFVVISGGK